MANQRNVGAVSAGHDDTRKKKGLGWLWALLALLAIAVVAFVALRNAGDDDPEGVGLSGQECPEYAGKEGRDETAEVAADATPFFGCAVAIVGPVERVLSDDAFLVATEGGEPILIVRGDGADGIDVQEGAAYGVEGTIEEALQLDDLGDIDTTGLDEFEGQPYLSAKLAEPSGS